MINSVIFDWSGVISDDWQAVFETANDVLEARGYGRMGKKRFRGLFELPWKNFYKKQGIKIDVGKEYSLWEKHFPRHMHRLKPFPRSRKVLEWLKEKGTRRIVFSSHNQTLVEKEIERYGLKGLVDSAYGSVHDKREKIEGLVKRHEIERKKTLYVGDLRHDIETARLARIKSVAVLGGYDSREKLEKEKPDYFIKSIAELPKLIESIEANGNG